MGKPVLRYLEFELPAAKASASFNTTRLCLQHQPTRGYEAAASGGGPGGPLAGAYHSDPAEPAVKSLWLRLAEVVTVGPALES